MERGKNLAAKHVEVFGSLLTEDDLSAPMTWDSTASNSTAAPISDKLMMFHSASLTAAGVGYYGASMGVSPRRDLGTAYSRLSLEVMQFAEDGVNIMIDHGWLEQPPTAPDRKALIVGKK